MHEGWGVAKKATIKEISGLTTYGWGGSDGAAVHDGFILCPTDKREWCLWRDGTKRDVVYMHPGQWPHLYERTESGHFRTKEDAISFKRALIAMLSPVPPQPRLRGLRRIPCSHSFPDAFWDSMTPVLQHSIAELESMGILVLPTGSRLICPNAVRPASDWDVFFMASWQQIEPLIQLGWKYSPGSGRQSDFASLKKHQAKLNAIMFWDHQPAAYNAFKLATDFCVSIQGPEDKTKRINVFNRIANGKPA